MLKMSRIKVTLFQLSRGRGNLVVQDGTAARCHIHVNLQSTARSTGVPVAGMIILGRIAIYLHASDIEPNHYDVVPLRLNILQPKLMPVRSPLSLIESSNLNNFFRRVFFIAVGRLKAERI